MDESRVCTIAERIIVAVAGAKRKKNEIRPTQTGSVNIFVCTVYGPKAVTYLCARGITCTYSRHIYAECVCLYILYTIQY